MLLYLTRTDISDLLDFTIDTYGFVPKKMIGSFSLLNFVIRDMRNFSNCKYFVIDRNAITEKDDELVQAICSFKTMYNSRVIIIYEGLCQGDSLMQKLVEVDVTDIVTADSIEEIKEEILECLSDKGMERYKQKKRSQLIPIGFSKTDEDKVEQYKFNCKNIKIAFAGAERRTGVTTTATLPIGYPPEVLRYVILKLIFIYICNGLSIYMTWNKRIIISLYLEWITTLPRNLAKIIILSFMIAVKSKNHCRMIF